MRLSEPWLVRLGQLGAVLLRLLSVGTINTWYQREQLADLVRGDGGVVALYHSRIPLLCGYFTRPDVRPLGTLASQSRDGALIAHILERAGFDVIRGSSSRGAVRAFVAMVKYLRPGHRIMAITVDGPRGPAQVCKPGAVALARRSQKPLIIASAAAHRPWRLRSWDCMIIPKPFHRAYCAFSKPIYLPAKGLSDEILAEKLNVLMARWHVACQRALERVS